MAIGVAFALAASLAWGFSDFLAGVQSRREQMLGLLIASQAVSVSIVVPIALASGQPLPAADDVLWLMAAALAELVGIVCFYRAMAIGEMGLVAPIAGTAALVPLSVDLVAGHRPGAIALIGVALALAGVLLTSSDRNTEQQAGAIKATGLAVVAALAFGLSFVGTDAGANGGVWWPVAITCSTSLAVVTLAAVLTGRSPKVSRSALPAVVAVGLTDVLANVLYVSALGHGLAGVVSTLSSLYPVTTVALAWLVLRERATAWQGLGVVGAVAGVALVSLGG
jgi:drug/metabolite transporter (DMT)-like permease